MLIDNLNSPDFKPDRDWTTVYTNNFKVFEFPENMTPNENRQALDMLRKMGVDLDDQTILELRFTPYHLFNLIVNVKRGVH
jgi:hypothetical protein